MFKKTLLIITLAVYSFAFNAEEFTHLQKKADPFQQIKFAKTLYQGDSYISKDEFNQLEKQILETTKVIKDGPFDFLLYFSSSSVPTKNLFNVLHEIGILQDNDIRLDTKMYFMGPPEKFKEYMYKIEEDMNKIPLLAAEEKVRKNFSLKIDPRYFHKFDLKKAPAMALAKCPGIVPNIKECKFSYLIKGDVSLTSFFYEISLKNKKFEKYVKLLQGNKIVKNGGI